ncbi:MAG: STAS domain-containing protein [Gammaproteobacteria bacterium]
MFEIRLEEDGRIALSGRLDAAQCGKAQAFLDGIEKPRVVDMADLDYISSAGLGVLLRTQKRLMASGSGLKMVNVNSHIGDIFRFSGFDQIFEIQRAPDA